MKILFLLIININIILLGEEYPKFYNLYESKNYYGLKDSLEYTTRANYSLGNKIGHSYFNLSDKNKDNNLKAVAAYILGLSYSYSDVQDSALYYLNISHKIASKSKMKILEADLKTRFGLLHRYKMEFEDALMNYFEALKIYKESGNTRKIAASYTHIGNIFKYLGEYNQSLGYLLLSLNEYEKDNWQEGIAWTRLSLGVVYRRLGNYEKALEQYLKSLEIYKRIFKNDKNNFGIAICHSVLGTLYSKMGNFEKAFYHSKYALKLRLDSGIKTVIGDEYKSLGQIYMLAGKNDSAQYYLNKALEIKNSIKDKNGIAYVKRYLAEINLKKRNLKKAKLLIDEALNEAYKNNLKVHIADLLETRIKYYELSNQYNLANKDYKELLKYKTELFSQEAKNKVTAVELKLNVIKKEKENYELIAQNKLNELKLESEVQIRNLLIVLFITSLILLVLLFKRYKLKSLLHEQITLRSEELKVKNRELEDSRIHLKKLNNTKDRFFSIISHDLRGPFTSLLGYAQMFKESYAEFGKDELKNISTSLFNITKNLYKLVDDLLSWAKAQSGNIKYEPTNIELAEVVNSIINLFFNSTKKKNLSVKNNIEKGCYIFSDFDIVNTIIRNIYYNAIKFTPENGTISFSCEKKDNEIILAISDSGTGMSEEEVEMLFKIEKQFTKKGTNNESGSGLGLILCKELVEIYKGKFGLNLNLVKDPLSLLHFH